MVVQDIKIQDSRWKDDGRRRHPPGRPSSPSFLAKRLGVVYLASPARLGLFLPRYVWRVTTDVASRSIVLGRSHRLSPLRRSISTTLTLAPQNQQIAFIASCCEVQVIVKPPPTTPFLQQQEPRRSRKGAGHTCKEQV
jgi:hypothetical protein